MSPGDPYYEAIQGMAAARIIQGYAQPGGTYKFLPLNLVYRWQFAKMVVGAFALPIDESMTSPFLDLDPDTPAIDMTEYVAVAYEQGITTGNHRHRVRTLPEHLPRPGGHHGGTGHAKPASGRAADAAPRLHQHLGHQFQRHPRPVWPASRSTTACSRDCRSLEPRTIPGPRCLGAKWPKCCGTRWD